MARALLRARADRAVWAGVLIVTYAQPVMTHARAVAVVWARDHGAVRAPPALIAAALAIVSAHTVSGAVVGVVCARCRTGENVAVVPAPHLTSECSLVFVNGIAHTQALCRVASAVLDNTDIACSTREAGIAAAPAIVAAYSVVEAVEWACLSLASVTRETRRAHALLVATLATILAKWVA